MLDTTPVTTAITHLISTGTTEQALLAAVTHFVPEPESGRAVASAAGRDDRGGAARVAAPLKRECHVRGREAAELRGQGQSARRACCQKWEASGQSIAYCGQARIGIC